MTAGQSQVSVAIAATRTDQELSVFDKSYSALPGPTARTYRLLTCLPVTAFDIDGAAAALGLTWQETAWELTVLAEARLLEELGDQEGRGAVYRFHDEVRDHAERGAQEDETEQARTETLRRWLDWLLVTASRAERLLTPSHRTLDRDVEHPPLNPVPFGEEEGAQAWSAAHQDDVAAAVVAAEEHGWDALVWQLTHAFWPLWRSRRPLGLSLDLHQRGGAAARRCGHRAAEREMLTTGVIALRGLDRYAEAAKCSESALALALEDGDRRSEAQALHELGACHRALGEGTLAVAVLSEAIAIRKEIGDAPGVALSQLVLGQVALDAGNVDNSISELARARQGLRAGGDRHDSARASALLGRAWAAARQYDRAEWSLTEALKEFRALGSVPWHARALELLGKTAADQNQHQRAADLYSQALEVAADVSPQDAERIRRQLADVAVTAECA